MQGYYGKLLRVDLSAGTAEDIPLNENYARDFIGGSGVAARYLYDMLDKSADPLAPENPLIIMTGPLTGSSSPLTGRHVVVGRSPLTGWLGESNVGGVVGAALRHAGYDGIIITGQAATPLWLNIDNQGADLRDASALWGLDAPATQAYIRQALSDNKVRVGCIGPAGENGVLYAGVVHDNGRMAARTGLGAVMGAKRLKAIAVRGRNAPDMPVAYPERFAAIASRVKKAFRDDVLSDILRTSGTAGNLDYLHLLGALPVRYFTQGEFDGAFDISGNSMTETILTGREGCYGCLVACGRKVTIPGGKYATGGEVKGPEYETIGAFGSLLLVDNLEAIAYAGHLCDRLGLDTISAGNVIALAIYLFQEGIISPADTGGLSLQWNDPDLTIKLVQDIAYRRGFGALLALGVQRFAEHFGADELAVQFNGMSPAMHDPRAYSGMAISYMTSPIGGSHNHSDYYWVENGRDFEALGITTPGAHVDEGKAAYVARHQNWNSVVNSLVACIFSTAPVPDYLALLNAATGRDFSPEEALTAGERIFNLQRALNIRLGYTPAGERLPKLLRQPLSEGGTEGFVPDEKLLRREYYQARQWDSESGKPTREKLSALGLPEIADDLYPAA